MNFANQVKNTLLQDIANMANVSWFFSKHPETDFTRKRKIDFQSLLPSLLPRSKASMGSGGGLCGYPHNPPYADILEMPI